MKPTTIVRVVLVALGIASATLLAHATFGIRFNEDFLLFLDIVRDAVGVVVLPFELLIVQPAVNWLHEHGWVFELRDHWRNAFVLLWLLFAAELRHVASPSYILGTEGVGWAVNTAFRWAWAALSALIGGVLAGTVPLDHPASLWWPVMAFFVHSSGDIFVYAFKERGVEEYNAFALGLVFALPFAGFGFGWVGLPIVAGQPPLFWWAVAAYFACRLGEGLILKSILRAKWQLYWYNVLYPIFVIAAGALALGVLPGPAWLNFGQSPGLGLANLAVFVAVLAAWHLINAVLRPDEGEGSYFDRVFNTSSARIALDVFAVLGGAAAIVYVGHLLA